MDMIDRLIGYFLNVNTRKAQGKTEFEDETWEIVSVEPPESIPEEILDQYYPAENQREKLSYKRVTIDGEDKLKIVFEDSNNRVQGLRFTTTYGNFVDSDFVEFDRESDFEIKAVSFISAEGEKKIMQFNLIFKDDEDKLSLGHWICKPI